ncbi:MAG: hypothetical protein MUF83_16010 [Acidimicrobiales bacterium]|jgi:hypothetical protein|nr:hypothetical protein [Acidimicrobiales bacterium]
MSDEAVPGALIAIGSAVFFIPKEDLDGYRIPDAAAAEALDAMGGDEVSGFSATGGAVPTPRVSLAKYQPQPLNYGTGWNFPLTLSRMCY